MTFTKNLHSNELFCDSHAIYLHKYNKYFANAFIQKRESSIFRWFVTIFVLVRFKPNPWLNSACNCRPTCNEVHYEGKPSFARYPSELMAEQLANRFNTSKELYLVILGFTIACLHKVSTVYLLDTLWVKECKPYGRPPVRYRK